MRSLVKLIILILATFRLSELITKDKGFKLSKNHEYGVFEGFRRWCIRKAIYSDNVFYENLADVVNCPFCVAPYILVIIILCPYKLQLFLAVLGGQSLLESLIKSER